MGRVSRQALHEEVRFDNAECALVTGEETLREWLRGKPSWARVSMTLTVRMDAGPADAGQDYESTDADTHFRIVDSLIQAAAPCQRPHNDLTLLTAET